MNGIPSVTPPQNSQLPKPNGGHKYTAVGAHVFAGSFTRGVMNHMNVDAQLEVHGLGVETTRQKLGVHVDMAGRWEDWPKRSCDLLFGNPRCTGFSCVTAGYGATAHGPEALQTKDIWDLIHYGLSIEPQIMMFESVRQAYSTGAPLLRKLIDNYVHPAGYRVAHVILTAATFGCCQHRVRYFFIAYKKGLQFNLSIPKLPERRVVLRDVIGHLENEEVVPIKESDLTYPDNGYYPCDDDHQACLERLERGWDLNMLGKYKYDLLPKRMKIAWKHRSSPMPFSMHCLKRTAYDVPMSTLFGGVMNHLVHPVKNRRMTVKEIACIMGQDFTPTGAKPGPQMVKAVCPHVGSWIAEQAVHCLNREWGDKDVVAAYDHRNLRWVQGDRRGPDEKTFYLPNYMTYA